jgi:hypothetical protein
MIRKTKNRKINAAAQNQEECDSLLGFHIGLQDQESGSQEG